MRQLADNLKRDSVRHMQALRASERWRHLSVGVVIAALLIAAVAPLAVVNLFLAWEARNEAIEHRATFLRSAALRSVSLQELALRTVDSALGLELAALSTVLSDQDACQEFLNRRLVGHPFINAALVISREGRAVCASARASIGLDFSDRPYFRSALHQPGLVVDEPIVARPSGRLVLPVARRLDGFAPGHGSPDDPAVVAAAFDLDALVRFLKGRGERGDDDILRDVDITVVDRHGVIVADLNVPARRGTIAPFRLTGPPLSAAQHVVPGFDGEPLLAAASPELPGGIRIVIGQAMREVVAAPHLRLLVSAIAASLALLAGLGIAYFLVTRVVLQPLASLGDMAARLQRGDGSAVAASQAFIGELERLRQSFVAMAQGILHRERQLRSQSEIFADMAYRDPLTGIANRRALDEFLDITWTAARSRQEPMSVLFLDIDHFKAFNDRYGHPAGDETLQKVARTLASLPLRADDMVARYGGEEFVLVLPATNATGAAAVAERARAAIEQLAIAYAGSATGVVTVSIGFATACPDDHSDLGTLVARADAALYTAKQAGRNRVCHADGQDAAGTGSPVIEGADAMQGEFAR